ncbi:cyclin-dependent kinase inhibitor 1-like [Gigantopelta aegis]|uniref:cyclin-dependent kinase inhibitor 1-like n=1 Tax=Gigantopelta aegis TaxID=1735272 RepID=UPI001B88DE76|nr:cyclin-dependent kinase inhibitor 1-like [Gigantopelta aegis]
MPEKRKVRRCLFGRPDHDVLKKELEKTLRDVEDGSVQKQKWNFDFDIGRPIRNNGRIEWTKVDNDCYIPEFYRKGYSTKTKMFRGLHSSELLTQPSVPRSTTQLDTLSQGNTTTNCSPRVTDMADVRTQTESVQMDVAVVNSKRHVCGSSITKSRNGSAVQSTIPDHMAVRKRLRASPVDVYIAAKAPRM